jgi:hypothetical protein
MSISTVNAFYYGSTGTAGVVSPTVSGQVFATANNAGQDAKFIRGFCVPILDGSATTFTVNWIDGTQQLLFPPDSVQAFSFQAPAWTASTSISDSGENASLGPPYTRPFVTYYPANYIITGLHSATNYVFQSNGGIAGATAPSWPASGTIADNTITWTNLGQVAATTLHW